MRFGQFSLRGQKMVAEIVRMYFAKNGDAYKQSNRDIALMLGVDERTVRNYKVRNGIPQLGVGDGKIPEVKDKPKQRGRPQIASRT